MCAKDIQKIILGHYDGLGWNRATENWCSIIKNMLVSKGPEKKLYKIL